MRPAKDTRGTFEIIHLSYTEIKLTTLRLKKKQNKQAMIHETKLIGKTDQQQPLNKQVPDLGMVHSRL